MYAHGLSFDQKIEKLYFVENTGLEYHIMIHEKTMPSMEESS